MSQGSCHLEYLNIILIRNKKQLKLILIKCTYINSLNDDGEMEIRNHLNNRIWVQPVLKAFLTKTILQNSSSAPFSRFSKFLVTWRYNQGKGTLLYVSVSGFMLNYNTNFENLKLIVLHIYFIFNQDNFKRIWLDWL